MRKLIAILNVVAWSGFWAFGYLALTSDAGAGRDLTLAALLAVLGAGIGMFTWFWLVRYTQATGYAPPSPQVPREHLRQSEGETMTGGQA